MPEFEFRAMGSHIRIVLDQEMDSASALVEDAPTWFEQWEQSLSRFRSDSELSLLNQISDQPVAVSPVLWEVYQTALWAEAYTNGLVTPTVHDALISSGYDRNFDSLPRVQHIQNALLSVVDPLSLVVTDERNRTLCLPPNVHLDFGGVAKGWAANEAMTKLKDHGPTLVNAGGDVAISGPRVGNAEWDIRVRNPFEAESSFEVIYVKQGGVATSGTDKRRWIQGGQLRHHIINPQTGLPAESDVVSATVIAPSVMEAEAAAKAVVIMGREQGFAWVNTKPELACIVVLENGNALYSATMQEYL
jgi:thiamine biosynthesis lipoprotein